MKNSIILTFDVDWAVDKYITAVVDLLTKHKVKSTWFITHPSTVIESLKNNELFELGIHPNFRKNSTQGKTIEEVLDYCLSIVPEAVSMRSHALYQSTDLIYIVTSSSKILFDSSTFLPYATNIRPTPLLWRDNLIIKVPFI